MPGLAAATLTWMVLHLIIRIVILTRCLAAARGRLLVCLAPCALLPSPGPAAPHVRVSSSPCCLGPACRLGLAALLPSVVRHLVLAVHAVQYQFTRAVVQHGAERIVRLRGEGWRGRMGAVRASQHRTGSKQEAQPRTWLPIAPCRCRRAPAPGPPPWPAGPRVLRCLPLSPSSLPPPHLHPINPTHLGQQRILDRPVVLAGRAHAPPQKQPEASVLQGAEETLQGAWVGRGLHELLGSAGSGTCLASGGGRTQTAPNKEKLGESVCVWGGMCTAGDACVCQWTAGAHTGRPHWQAGLAHGHCKGTADRPHDSPSYPSQRRGRAASCR
jgi:hypothetical protein